MHRLVIIGIALLVITMPLAFVIPVVTVIPGLVSSTLYTLAYECVQITKPLQKLLMLDPIGTDGI